MLKSEPRAATPNTVPTSRAVVVAEALFAEANLSPEDLIEVIRGLLREIGYPLDSFKILLKEKSDVPVRLVWYPGEGHGNRNAPARYDYTLRLMQWVDWCLRRGKKDLPPFNKEIAKKKLEAVGASVELK